MGSYFVVEFRTPADPEGWGAHHGTLVSARRAVRQFLRDNPTGEARIYRVLRRTGQRFFVVANVGRELYRAQCAEEARRWERNP